MKIIRSHIEKKIVISLADHCGHLPRGIFWVHIKFSSGTSGLLWSVQLLPSLNFYLVIRSIWPPLGAFASLFGKYFIQCFRIIVISWSSAAPIISGRWKFSCRFIIGNTCTLLLPFLPTIIVWAPPGIGCTIYIKDVVNMFSAQVDTGTLDPPLHPHLCGK